jgi:hypothetical protein
VWLWSNGLRAILIAVICRALLASGAEAQQRPYYFGRTKDPTPVEVALQDRDQLILFKIPKVYMTFSDNWKGGVQDFIYLETIFPSMAPVSATRWSGDDADVVAIDLMSYANTGADKNVSRELKWEIATQWTLVDRITDESGQKFLVYVANTDVAKRAVRNVIIDEYLLPDSAKHPDIYFKCLRKEGNFLLRCRAHSNFGQNLSLEFNFEHTELQRWQEIRDAVIKLLNGFRQEPQR